MPTPVFIGSVGMFTLSPERVANENENINRVNDENQVGKQGTQKKELTNKVVKRMRTLFKFFSLSCLSALSFCFLLQLQILLAVKFVTLIVEQGVNSTQALRS